MEMKEFMFDMDLISESQFTGISGFMPMLVEVPLERKDEFVDFIYYQFSVTEANVLKAHEVIKDLEDNDGERSAINRWKMIAKSRERRFSDIVDDALLFVGGQRKDRESEPLPIDHLFYCAYKTELKKGTKTPPTRT